MTSSAIVSTEERETRSASSSIATNVGEVSALRRSIEDFPAVDTEAPSEVLGLERTCCEAGAWARMISEMEGATVLVGVSLGGGLMEATSSVEELMYVELPALEDDKEPVLEDMDIFGMVKVGYRVTLLLDVEARGERGLGCFS